MSAVLVSPGRFRPTSVSSGRLLLVLLTVFVLSAAAGCSDPGAPAARGLTVLTPWTGPEGESFRGLLDGFEAEHGVEVELQGTTATHEVLLSGVQEGDPPDIAVLPGLGQLAEYLRQGELEQLDEATWQEYSEPWLPRPAEDGSLYWFPVKADLKSIVWYREDRPPDGPEPDASRWCIGMGSDATSGWPGSDWIEDILLHQSGPADYNAWATGELAWTAQPVVRAWRTWGQFVKDAGEKTAARALRTDHRGAEQENGLLFGSGSDCYLEHQGSFARGMYREDAGYARFVPSPRVLPQVASADSRHREVAADFAAMFRESPQAQALMRYLASGRTQRKWAAADPELPVFSAHRDATVEIYRDPVSKQIARELRDRRQRCLDASDVMPPTIRRLFHEKVLEYLGTPGTDPRPLLEEIQRVQEEGLPARTRWLEDACG